MLLPSGSVTLMFTDIEGSTRLLTALGDRYADVLDGHRKIVRSTVAQTGGAEVDTQGDAFFVAFTRAGDAVTAAVEIQRALDAHRWPEGARLRVRIGLHTGAPARSAEGYVGLDVHRGARICAAAHGGQVVLSRPTYDLLDSQPDGITIRSLGAHRLKDLDEPLTLFDLVVDGLNSEFPPLHSVGSRPTNLPVERPELFGRGRELAAVDAILRAGPTRLVTLTGPGGIGKSTLGLHVAAGLLDAHPDGAFAVLLAPVQGAQRFAEAVADTLGLREQTGAGPVEVVARYLADRAMLLLLDNFEHIIDAAPDVARLLDAAPGLRVVVTSRTPLRLRGEREFPVPPLPADPAAELFVRRAEEARPDFVADDTATAEICARLEGVPLAIELVAARVRLLSPAAILQRLAAPLELAAGGPRHLPTRQQALRASIDWSHDLLADRQRRTFARLGVFAGPFTIEAAEQVCDAHLDDLADLLDHSLLHARDNGRLACLETVRAYARERLDDDVEATDTRRRHALWCAELADAATPHLLSSAFIGLQDRFAAEQDDIRAALDWLVSTGDGDTAVRLAAGVAVFWDIRGQLTEGRVRLEAALAVADDRPTAHRAVAMYYAGRMAMLQGDADRGTSASRAALALFRRLGDARGASQALSHLGGVQAHLVAGPDEARPLIEEALELARSSGDLVAEAFALNDLSLTLFDGDDKDRAAELLTEGVGLARRAGAVWPLTLLLGNSGELALLDDRPFDAVSLLDEALELALGLGMEGMILDVRINLARVAWGEGRPDRVETLLGDALEGCRRTGEAVPHAICLYGLARLAESQGRAPDSAALRNQADLIAGRHGFSPTPFDRWEP